VLNQGRIQEQGTYDELIAANGFFAELIKRQRLDA
jgi:ABC-type multidrug transport system fused ATPase/permease subunit